MCVGICITRRGMVYFGASIHIFVTFILFIGSSVRAFHLTTYEKEDGRKEILGGFIIATYFFVLLMLGCLIFRATEQVFINTNKKNIRIFHKLNLIFCIEKS